MGAQTGRYLILGERLWNDLHITLPYRGLYRSWPCMYDDNEIIQLYGRFARNTLPFRINSG
jgi:hypothetical protein